MVKKAISVDIGGTSIKMAIIDEQGNINEKWQIKTNITNHGEKIIEEIVVAIETHIIKYPRKEFIGIGIGVPGPISVDGTKVVRAVNLGWKEIPLKKLIEDRFRIPVQLLNDANAAALGELWSGAGRGTRNMLFVTLGTGVGAGIILDGSIINGAHSSGGEIGHIPVLSTEHRLCGCGNINCLESFASANGMVKTMTRILNGSGIQRDSFTTIDIFNWLADGDQFAERAVNETVEYLGSALAGVLNTVDVDRIVIGGGLSGAGDALMNPLKKVIDKCAFPQIRSSYSVTLSELGNDAGIFGDAASFFNK